MVDIIVATHNRLQYLEKCIMSIVASTSLSYRLTVVDDYSTDDTTEWISSMVKKGLIHNAIYNDKNEGTVKSYNKGVKNTTNGKIVILNDDMWLHRDWLKLCLDKMNSDDKIGIISFYNYTRLKLDNAEKIDNNWWKVKRTGLGASIMDREIFMKVEGFNLPDTLIMGYFASSFCVKFNRVFPDKIHLCSAIPYAIHMDNRNCKLNEIESLQGYIARRKRIKRGNSEQSYITSDKGNKKRILNDR